MLKKSIILNMPINFKVIKKLLRMIRVWKTYNTNAPEKDFDEPVCRRLQLSSFCRYW